MLAGVVVTGVIVLAIMGIVSLATRKPENNPYPRELADLRAEVAQLREEVRELKQGRPATKSTNITDLG